GRVLEETQDGSAVSSTWIGDGRRLGLTYASGTHLDLGYDTLKRLKTIAQAGSTVAQWSWIGPGLRPLKRALENGTTLSFLDSTGTQDVGWDSVKRPARMHVY